VENPLGAQMKPDFPDFQPKNFFSAGSGENLRPNLWKRNGGAGHASFRNFSEYRIQRGLAGIRAREDLQAEQIFGLSSRS
jgi:hypothetical protein